MFLFVSTILNTDAEAKKEKTIDELALFHNDETLLHLLNFPTFVDGREVKMKDLVLLAVNTNNQDLFEEKMREYFEKHYLKGSVSVFDAALSGKWEAPLLSFRNAAFGAEHSSTMEIPNERNEKIAYIVVVLVT